MATSKAALAKRGREIGRWIERNDLFLGRGSYDEMRPEEYAELGRVAMGQYEPPIFTPYEFIELVRKVRRASPSRKNHRLGNYLLQFLDDDGEVMRLKSVAFKTAVIPDLGIRAAHGDIVRKGVHFWRTRWVGEVTDDKLMLLYMSLSPEERAYIPQ